MSVSPGLVIQVHTNIPYSNISIVVITIMIMD